MHWEPFGCTTTYYIVKIMGDFLFKLKLILLPSSKSLSKKSIKSLKVRGWNSLFRPLLEHLLQMLTEILD